MNRPCATKRQPSERVAQRAESHAMRQQPLALVGRWEWHLLTQKYTWGEEMFLIFNRSPQAAPLRTGSFFNCVHPEDKEKVVRAFGMALVGKQPLQIEHRIVWPDGTVRLVRGEAEVSFDRVGRPVSMSGTIRDITGFQESQY